MDIYSIALFVHIAGAALIFVLLTVEGMGARAGIPSAELNRVLGPISALAILIPGLYMMSAQWGWAGWAVVGIVAWFGVAVVGAATGIGVMRGRVARRTAAFSWLARVGMTTGVLFAMTVKPDALASAAAVIAGTALALGAGIAWPRLAART